MFISTDGYNPVTALADYTAMMVALILAVAGVLFWRRR